MVAAWAASNYVMLTVSSRAQSAFQMKICVYSNMIRIWSIGKEAVRTARFPPGLEPVSATTTSDVK
jgi:hypothetical protein